MAAGRLSRQRGLDFRIGKVVGCGDQTAVEEPRRIDVRIDQSQPAIQLRQSCPHIPLKITERLGDRIVEAGASFASATPARLRHAERYRAGQSWLNRVSCRTPLPRALSPFVGQTDATDYEFT